LRNPWIIRGIELEPEDRVFLMIGSANRDENYFERADEFDVAATSRKTSLLSLAQHFCAGAWASRAMLADGRSSYGCGSWKVSRCGSAAGRFAGC
jgi:cytochrome P450